MFTTIAIIVLSIVAALFFAAWAYKEGYIRGARHVILRDINDVKLIDETHEVINHEVVEPLQNIGRDILGSFEDTYKKELNKIRENNES